MAMAAGGLGEELHGSRDIGNIVDRGRAVAGIENFQM